MMPISKMSSKQIDVMLYGTETLVDFDYKSNSGSRWGRTDSFEACHWGSMQRHFSETDSESKREWLGRFMRDTPCKKCEGKKLKPESLAVRLDGSMGIMVRMCIYTVDNRMLEIWLRK